MSNKSKHNASDLGLSVPQITALETIASGKSMNESAAAARVDRSTLYRWRKDDVAFQAALAGLRNHAREELSTRLLTLAAKSLAVVDAALDAGDARTAIAILRGCGVLSGAPQKECEDPEELRVVRGEEQANRSQRETLSLFLGGV